MSRARCALVALALLAACSEAAPLVGVPYQTSFDGVALGPEWQSTGGRWAVVDGRLFNDGAHNVPLWLSARLPRDVRIAFTVESKSPEVDFKCELFGDGKAHSSGYIAIFAGWKNTTSLIARLDEHGAKRTLADEARLRTEVSADPKRAAAQYAGVRDAVSRAVELAPNRVYRVTIERRGNFVRSFLDDELHVEYFDPSPLEGAGHDRFAFSNWASTLFFDDLVITPLAP